MEELEYQNYIKWKGWLEKNNTFFTINKTEKAEFESEFRACKVHCFDKTVLEIGYGAGKLLRFLNDNGCKVAGVEIQKELLNAATEKELTVYSNISKVTGKYDLIVGFDVLEHLTISQLKELFSVAHKILDLNGKMLFRFPNADSYAGMAAQNGDYTHMTSIGKMKLEQLIAPYGFFIESFHGANEYPNRPIKRAIHWMFRSVLIKLIGFDRPYFFSGNVVAVIKRKTSK